jgi:hypothetical protein
MRVHRLALSLAAAVLVVTPAAGQTPEEIAREPIVKIKPGDTPVKGECLSKEQLDLVAALNALRRPTVGVEGDGDDPSPFNPHYFIGAWNIEGVLADSPLGPGGEVAATETVRLLDRCTYESTLRGKTQDAGFTITALTMYDRRNEYLVRLEDDSRGYRLLKVGHIGGDPGGYAAHIWETQPVSRGRNTVRLKGRTLMWSPEAFRVQLQISIDGAPYTNLGTLTWERTASAKP